MPRTPHKPRIRPEPGMLILAGRVIGPAGTDAHRKALAQVECGVCGDIFIGRWSRLLGGQKSCTCLETDAFERYVARMLVSLRPWAGDIFDAIYNAPEYAVKRWKQPKAVLDAVARNYWTATQDRLGITTISAIASRCTAGAPYQHLAKEYGLSVTFIQAIHHRLGRFAVMAREAKKADDSVPELDPLVPFVSDGIAGPIMKHGFGRAFSMKELRRAGTNYRGTLAKSYRWLIDPATVVPSWLSPHADAFRQKALRTFERRADSQKIWRQNHDALRPVLSNHYPMPLEQIASRSGLTGSLVLRHLQQCDTCRLKAQRHDVNIQPSMAKKKVA